MIIPSPHESQTYSVHPKEKSTSDASSSEQDEEADCTMPADFAENLVRRTERRVAQILFRSHFIRKNCKIQNMPRFERKDMEIGEMISFGGFSNVHEVLSFNTDTELSKGENKRREYVVKHLSPKLAFDHKRLVTGAKDLLMEAYFLSSLDHRNILQLEGLSAAGAAGFAETGRADGFFLVLERLNYTLKRRILDWRAISKENGLCSIMKSRSNARIKLFDERIQVAEDLASAVEYLHSKRIVYRDLKPANIGFDRNGVVKIFDFGLAVELPEGSDPDLTFKLAGNSGTARYMAVEVIKRHPYNLKADVFSFSILLWEMMALSKPYKDLDGQQVKACVAVYGERPKIPRTWPSCLRHILRRGWSESLTVRPHITEVKDVLIQLREANSQSNKSSRE